jgi:hypothetical protein
MTDTPPPPPGSLPPGYRPPPGYYPPGNVARVVWIVVGALILTFGIGSLGMPVFVALLGAPIDLGRAFLSAAAADVALAGVYTAGLLVARRAPDGRLRAIPPAIAAGVLFVGFIAAFWGIFAIAGR